MPLDIVILGPPGAGKGTQAKRICDELGIAHVATGDMLRAAMDEGTALGKQVAEIVEQGDLVPDDLMIELIRERISMPDTAAGFLLDGFPRTHAQAQALNEMLSSLRRAPLSLVLQLQVPDRIVAERLLGRAQAEGRTDDAPEVVQRRLELFREQTEPVVAYYRAQGILVGIHGDRTVDEVFAEIQAVLETAAAR